MRRLCLGIAGIGLAVSLGGCGESSEEGPHSYKGSNSPAIQKQLEIQSANAKSKAITTKTVEEKPAPKKEADKKPAGEPAPEKK